MNCAGTGPQAPIFKMAINIRNTDWEEDKQLRTNLNGYVLKNLSRREISDFVSRDYPQYEWSLGTLSRKLAFLDIRYIRYDTDIDVVTDAVRKEAEDPGQLLGYRRVHKKLREQHNIAVPCNLVYDVMGVVDPEGLEGRGNVGNKKRRRGATGTFTSLVMYAISIQYNKV